MTKKQNLKKDFLPTVATQIRTIIEEKDEYVFLSVEAQQHPYHDKIRTIYRIYDKERESLIEIRMRTKCTEHQIVVFPEAKSCKTFQESRKISLQDTIHLFRRLVTNPDSLEGLMQRELQMTAFEAEQPYHRRKFEAIEKELILMGALAEK